MIDSTVQDVLYGKMAASKTEYARLVPSRGLQLLELPDEILAYVFQFIDNTDDLINNACVNSRFKELSEPYLYRNIEIFGKNQALSFSAAVKAKPVRAGRVKTFLLSPTFGEHEGLQALPDIIRSMRNVRTLRLETPDLNHQQPRARIPWITLQERYERIFEGSSILVPNPTHRYLPFLTECTIHFVDSETELYGLPKYSTLFLHPNLRSLTISCTSTGFPNELLKNIGDDTTLQGQTNLTNLHLEECDLHAGTLAKILRYPKALKRLTISEGIRYTVMNSFHRRPLGDMYPGELKRALSEQVHALEFLSLSLGYLRPEFATINTPSQQLDLRDFTALKTLELCDRTLHLVMTAPDCDHGLRRRLPLSLEKLVVFEVRMRSVRTPLGLRTREAYFPLARCIFRKKKCGLPSLQRVVLKYITYGEDEDMDAVALEGLQILKESLKDTASKCMGDMQKSGMSLQIDQVILPQGFIPPYRMYLSKFYS
jgi:F-box-like